MAVFVRAIGPLENPVEGIQISIAVEPLPKVHGWHNRNKRNSQRNKRNDVKQNVNEFTSFVYCV